MTLICDEQPESQIFWFRRRALYCPFDPIYDNFSLLYSPSSPLKLTPHSHDKVFTVNDLMDAHFQINASYLINAPLLKVKLVLDATLF